MKKRIILGIIFSFFMVFALGLKTDAAPVDIDYSQVYDYEYYKSTYADLREVFGQDENLYYMHFINYGMKEGRRASKTFDVLVYKHNYTDLRVAFGDDNESYFKHFIIYGKNENRNSTTYIENAPHITSYKGVDLSEIFDFKYYTDTYPDIKAAYGSDDNKVIEHFVKYGILEGRKGKEEYNQELYNILYRISSFMPTAPKMAYGVDISSVYDYFYYAWHHRDVSNAFDYDPMLVAKHFAEFGIMEGRRGKVNYLESDRAYINSCLAKAKDISGLPSGMIEKANTYSTNTGWLILVDKAAKKTVIFKGNKGNYGVDKVYNCVVGAGVSPTPSGIYHSGIKGLYFDTGAAGRCWYYTQISGNYLFHSQIYDRSSMPVRLIDARMGVSASHGCIRLTLGDAKYIYDNLPRDSTIVVY